MAFRKRRQSHEPTRYDDPLGVARPDIEQRLWIPEYVPVPTGLSAEEDLARILRMEFDKVGFCRNCEESRAMNTTNGEVVQTWCPTCEIYLSPVGTPPIGTRHKR